MTAASLTLLVNVVTSILKRWVYPKYGIFGVHVLAFTVAFVAAIYFTYLENIQSIANIFTEAIGLFSLSVALYEVVLQYIPSFKVNSINRTDA